MNYMQIRSGKILKIDIAHNNVLVALWSDGQEKHIAEMPIGMFPSKIDVGNCFEYYMQATENDKIHRISWIPTKS